MDTALDLDSRGVLGELGVVEWSCHSPLPARRVGDLLPIKQARTHVAQINAEFGAMPLSSIRPSHVKAWTTKLAERGHAPSYVYALHARLAQIMADAVHDGIIPRSPCSRRTSPPQAKQRAYVATTEQVWALHDAIPDHLRATVLLGAFAGLRTAEVCGLRIADVDFMRGIITPAVQYPAEPLKTEISKTPIPIPRSLTNALSAHVARWRPAELPATSDTLMSTEIGSHLGPWGWSTRCRPHGMPWRGCQPGSGSTTCATTSHRC